MKQPWYKSTHVIIMMLILVFPVGLICMWKYATWSRLLKLVVTVGFLVALSYATVLYFERDTTSTQETSTQESASNKQATDPSIASVVPDKKENVVKQLSGGSATVKHFAYVVVDPVTGKPGETNEKMMKYTVQNTKKENCADTACAVYVWDSQASYDAVKDTLGKTVQLDVTANKEHLMAVLAVDGTFYYKGERAK